MKAKCVMILHSNSSYIGVCDNFLALFKKYWPDCPYKLVVSLTGEKYDFSGYKTINNGKSASLIEAIYNVSKKYDSDYYCCFLGDALFNTRNSNSVFTEIIDSMKENGIDYCSLKYKKPFHKVRKYNSFCRYIHSSDRYSHNYGAFIISKSFLTHFFSKFDNDFQFEKYYLDIAKNKDRNYFFDNDIIVSSNFMGLSFAIVKGKWDRISLHKLKKKNPEIRFEDLETNSFVSSFLLLIRSVVDPYIPLKLRRKFLRFK